MSDMVMNDDLLALASRAYTYGFPLVFNLEQVQRYITTGIGANKAAPFNTFSHARTLAGPEDRFVTINNDTVYSMAQIDLSVGPLMLEVPDAGQRYYVLQLVSAWTDNFAYIGKRATGTSAGRFLLVPPGWSGDDNVDEGVTIVRAPTRVFSIVGRWAVTTPDDLVAVHRLQDATTLTPLDEPTNGPEGLPVTSVEDPALRFWETYRLLSRAFPPAVRDEAVQASFAPLGLTGDRPVDELDAEVVLALREAQQLGADAMAASLRGGHVDEQNGWLLAYHAFDYNLDHFEVGTKDEARWKIEDPEERLVIRAGAALGGLWGNHAYEAAYAALYTDADGEPLTGVHDYEVRFSPTPPNGAFWSLTMYDVPDYYLVPNPIDRYSVGDRTLGTVPDDDGGLTIRLSTREPSDARARANWLPTPPGPFRPMLRVYVPGDAILDQTYPLHPIRRL